MSRLIFIGFSTITFLIGQSSYIRSTLPVRDGIIYNPDSGRPFSEYATEYFDNGQVKVKGRYSGGFANGYWSYYHPNGQIKARGRYYKAIDGDQNKIIEGLDEGSEGEEKDIKVSGQNSNNSKRFFECKRSNVFRSWLFFSNSHGGSLKT